MKTLIHNITNKNLDSLNMKNYEYIDNTEYINYYLEKSSQEHYRLLTYLSNNIDNSIILDIGTFKGVSALALSSNMSNTIYSFNLGQELQLNTLPKNINWIIDNVMNDQYKNIVYNAKIILLDTYHDGIFEKLFYDYLKNIHFKGILLLDDIKLNKEMIDFWNAIELDKEDISYLGHITGTGIVYFS